MPNLENGVEEDYYNKVEINVKTKHLISAEDMQAIQDACKTIVEKSQKYFSSHTAKADQK